MPSVAEDLAALERVMLRLAMTETDKLAPVLDKLLVPLLRRLGDEPVRAKVLELIQHIMTRARPDASVLLPAAALLALFADPEASPMTRNFALVFLQLAVARAPPETRAPLLPGLLRAMAGRSEGQRDMLFHLVLENAGELDVAAAAAAPPPAEMLSDVLLFRSAETATVGMSRTGRERLAKQWAGQSAEQLAARRVAVVEWLLAGLLPGNAALPLLLQAVCDSHHAVVARAESALRRVDVDVDSDLAAQDALFGLVGVAEEPVMARALALLQRSEAATRRYPDAFRAALRAGFSAQQPRLNAQGLEFLCAAVAAAADADAAAMAPQLLPLLRREAEQPPLPPGSDTPARDRARAREHVYRALGALARRAPACVAGDVRLASLLFARLAGEPADLRLSVHEALEALRPAFADVPAPARQRLQTSLVALAGSDEQRERLSVVAWLAELFPPGDVPSCAVFLRLAADSHASVRAAAEARLAVADPPFDALAAAVLPQVDSEGMADRVAAFLRPPADADPAAVRPLFAMLARELEPKGAERRLPLGEALLAAARRFPALAAEEMSAARLASAQASANREVAELYGAALGWMQPAGPLEFAVDSPGALAAVGPRLVVQNSASASGAVAAVAAALTEPALQRTACGVLRLVCDEAPELAAQLGAAAPLLGEQLCAAMNARDMALVEAAVGVVARLCERDPCLPARPALLDALLALAPVKQEAVLFAAGDAMCALAHGGQLVGTGTATTAMETVLDRVLALDAGSPVARAAGAVWLLCIVAGAADHPVVQRRALQLQSALIDKLSEPADFTQECAAKGMALLFQSSAPAAAAGLVAAAKPRLEMGMRGGLRPKSEEEEEEAAQGKEGEEKKAEEKAEEEKTEEKKQEKRLLIDNTTYRELWALAACIEQPALFYELLELSSTASAAWAIAEHGKAFQDPVVQARAQAAVQAQAVRLIPALFRFRYDPHKRTRAVMTRLWALALGDGEHSVDAHYAAIMQEALDSTTSPKNRFREAACLALPDLVSGRPAALLLPWLERLWRAVLRAVDDVSLSVTEAAVRAVRAVGAASARLCEEDDAAVGLVLPFLIEHGFVHRSKPARLLSVHYAAEIVAVAGARLAPHVARLVPLLLESVTELEPQALQQAMHLTSHEGVSRERVEELRVAAARDAPIGRSVEKCLEFADAAALADLVPRLVQLVRTGTGLPTRCAVAAAIGSLVQRYPTLMREHAQLLLRALSGALTDESPAARRAFATAAGAVARLARPSTVRNYARHVCGLYRAAMADEEARRETAARALAALGDVPAARDEMLPLAFIARHDPCDAVRDAFGALWDATATAIDDPAPYVAAVADALGASSWLFKRQGALALIDLVRRCGERVAGELLPLVRAALPGRLWTGKQVLLRAFVAASRGGGQLADADVTLLVAETHRSKAPYRRAAVDAIGELAPPGVSEQLLPALQAQLATKLDADGVTEAKVDDDAPESEHDPDMLRALVRALGRCPPAAGQVDALCAAFVDAGRGTHWSTRAAAVEALGLLCAGTAVAVASRHVEACVTAALPGIADPRFAGVRAAAAGALLALVSAPALRLSVLPHKEEILAAARGALADTEPRVAEVSGRVVEGCAGL